jgi:hypothetical protein
LTFKSAWSGYKTVRLASAFHPFRPKAYVRFRPIADISPPTDTDRMEHALWNMAIATIGIWSAYLLFIVTVATRLSEWLSPPEVITTILLPVAMLVASAWIGFWSAPRLSPRAAFLGQLLFMALGCLFLISLFTARAA